MSKYFAHRRLRWPPLSALCSFGLTPSHAAGALAIGKCAAYGYAYDYPSVQAAEAAARAKCSDRTCNQVVATQKGCVAFAVDGRKRVRSERLRQCVAAWGRAEHRAQALLQVRRQGLRDPRLDLRRQGLTGSPAADRPA